MKSFALPICLLAVFGTVEIASATLVGVDCVVVQNPAAATFGDLFDGPALGTPPWYTVGSPGPQAGGLLQMAGGDSILAAISVDPQESVVAQAFVNLTSFDAGSALALTLMSEQENIGLVVSPAYSFVGDNGGVLGAVALDPGASVWLSLKIDPSGDIEATVNGALVYTGPGPGPLSISAVALQVVPEPATALTSLMLSALVVLRRPRSGHAI